MIPSDRCVGCATYRDRCVECGERVALLTFISHIEPWSEDIRRVYKSVVDPTPVCGTLAMFNELERLNRKGKLGLSASGLVEAILTTNLSRRRPA